MGSSIGFMSSIRSSEGVVGSRSLGVVCINAPICLSSLPIFFNILGDLPIETFSPQSFVLRDELYRIFVSIIFVIESLFDNLAFWLLRSSLEQLGESNGVN